MSRRTSFVDLPGHSQRPSAVVCDRPLDTAEASFQLLCAGPAPLALDGREVGHGLPRRSIPLTELASVLMHPSVSFEASDAAWRHLIAQARGSGPAWVVGAVGVALPGLRTAAARLGRFHDPLDAQAEVLAGFVAALTRLDVDAIRVCPRLCNAAFVAARAALREQQPAGCGEGAFAPGSALPPSPWGHPDFILARAVKLGVLTGEEADLIGVTRLEDTTLSEYAARLGVPLTNLHRRRRQAEARLVAAIADGPLSDTRLIAEATLTAAPPTVARQHRP